LNMSRDCVRRAIRRAVDVGAKILHELSLRFCPRTGYDRFRDIMYILETGRINFLPVDPQRVKIENSFVRVALRRICDGDPRQIAMAALDLRIEQLPVQVDYESKDDSMYTISMDIARVVAVFVSRVPRAQVVIFVDTRRQIDAMMSFVSLYIDDIAEGSRRTTSMNKLVFLHMRGDSAVSMHLHATPDSMGPRPKDCIQIEMYRDGAHMHDIY
jgi:hypothetical protein